MYRSKPMLFSLRIAMNLLVVDFFEATLLRNKKITLPGAATGDNSTSVNSC